MQLLDCYLPVIFKVLEKTEQAEKVTIALNEQNDIIADLLTAQKVAEQFVFSKNDIHSAQFAIVAWIDEHILCSKHDIEQWKVATLQSQLYTSTIGGVAFFDKLNQLDKEQVSVRLVYLFCLLLGFHGYLKGEGQQALKKIFDDEINKLENEYKHFLLDEEVKLITFKEENKVKKWHLFDIFLLAMSAVVFIYIFMQFFLFSLFK